MAEPNGFLTRLTAVSGIIRDVGFPVVMVGIFVGWATGWIPLKPLDTLNTSVSQHDARVALVEQQRMNTDRKIADALDRFVLLTEKIERRDRLTYCMSNFKDMELRRECLK